MKFFLGRRPKELFNQNDFLIMKMIIIGFRKLFEIYDFFKILELFVNEAKISFRLG